MNSPVILAAAGLVAVLAVAWLWTTLTERRRRGVQARLAAVLAAPLPSAPSQAALALRRPDAPRGTGPLGRIPARIQRDLGDQLAATGDRIKVWDLLFLAVVVALGVGVLLVGVLQWAVHFALPLAVAVGLAGAVYRLRVAQRRFQRQFVDLFPEGLDVIVRAVRAGLPVVDSIEAAAASVSEPVAGEFRKLMDDLRIGRELEEALERAANRVRVSDFRFFAVTLILQRRTGGSLAETLSNLASLIRRRKELRLKARALSAESRATAYLIGVLPFVMGGILYLVNPGLVSMLFTDPRGNVILGTAVFLLVTGFALMRAMIGNALR